MLAVLCEGWPRGCPISIFWHKTSIPFRVGPLLTCTLLEFLLLLLNVRLMSIPLFVLPALVRSSPIRINLSLESPVRLGRVRALVLL